MTSFPISLAVCIFISHFLGDWLFQSDWMAINKSKSIEALSTHVGIVTLTMMVCMQIWLGFVTQDIMLFTLLLPIVLIYVAVNGALHWITDFWTSKLTSRLFFFKLVGRLDLREGYGYVDHLWEMIPSKRHWFFVVIGLDQLIHYLTYFLTAGWLL